jgi:peptide/nickel transport system substrate-binding protein
MRKLLYTVLSVLTVLALLAGCAPEATEVATEEPAVPTQAPAAPEPEEEEEPFKVGMVTDVGGIDDKSFNATSWHGMEMAEEELGAEVAYLESQQQTDYAVNITQFLDQDYDMIITVGYLLGEDTATFAEQNPDTNFAIVDYAYDPPIPNALGLTFSTDEAAFLAGYLAAGMSKTGKVGTFGGIEIPTVTIFMTGMKAGVDYYNKQHGTNVEVLGMNLFTGNFESTDDGRRFAEDLMAEGADIIMPVAGPVGLGTAAAIQENPGTMLIGVDTDWCISAPEYCDVTLTSVLKNMDVAVRDAIKMGIEGTFEGGTYVGTLKNDGVGIADPHEIDVPADLLAEVEEVKNGLVAGTLTVAGELVEAPVMEEAGPLIVGTTDSVTDLDPAESYDFHTWELFYNMAGTLVTYVPGSTQLEPELAAEMPTVSDDGLEWTVKLRPDMVFPDGTPLDANAVKWSVDRVVRLEGDPNWLVSSFLEEAVVVDDLTIVFKLQNPVGFFPYLLVDPPWAPVSPNCYSEDGFDSDSTCSGLGPYKIKRWERDVEMELEANPDYPGDPPKWPSIIVRYFADATTMRLALENGEIDVAWKTLLPTDYIDLEDNPNLNVIEGPGAYIRYICINATTEPFDDIRIKQAFSLAIDRDEISDRVYLGTHQPLYSMVPMGMEGHIDAFPERDLDAARALLEEAGYSEANPLEMDLWWTPAHYGDTEADVVTVIKANLEETGMIVVSLQSAEWATYTDNFGPGTMPVFLLGWYPDYLDPDNYTWSFAHSEAADDLGIFYANDEMDALLEEAQTEADMDTRMDLYAQIQELWTTECPTIPFTQGALYAVTQKNVSGVTLATHMLFPYFLLEK